MVETRTLTSPAKLNLALAVGQRRDDGMHPICSWMISIDLADEMQLTRLEDDRLSRYAILWHEDARRRSDIDWPITRDLAVRAHLAMELCVGRRLPVQMKLEKRIPVGGGLGGGSSNAAAMLRGLNDLFALGLERRELMALGAALGSDVPFMLTGGSAIVEGVGDAIEMHERTPELHAALAFPECGCPTGAVYGAFDELHCASTEPAKVRALVDATSLHDSLFNDLAEPAAHVAPSLREHGRAIAAMADRPAYVTGSGSTLFVLCDDALHAEALSRAIEARTGLASLPVSSAGSMTTV
jgi:4-diphosphocytidyl-2-C-methyl-D-erythritol kinase